MINFLFAKKLITVFIITLLSVGANTQEVEFFIAAAARGDISSVNQWLRIEEKPDVNATYNGTTALIEAAKHGHEEVVQALVDAGADVNLKVKELFLDINEIKIDVKKRIEIGVLDAGLAFDLPWRSRTALAEAVENGHEGTVALLLDYKANPDTTIENGRLWTIDFENIFNIEIEAEARDFDKNRMRLLDAGVKLFDILDVNATPILIHAAVKGYRGIVNKLLDFADPAIINTRISWILHEPKYKITRELHTALMRAVEEGHEDIVTDLIDAGADVNIKIEHLNTWTALIRAVEIGDRNIVERLIDAGADVNVFHADFVNEKMTVLDLAESRRQVDDKIVDMLVDAGAKRAAYFNK